MPHHISQHIIFHITPQRKNSIQYDHIKPVAHHSTFFITPPHYMPLHFTSHTIPHHNTTSDIAPPHLTSQIFAHHTWYALDYIVHDTIPRHHIALPHIAHHSCILQPTDTFHITLPHHIPYLTPHYTSNLNCNILQRTTTSYYTTFESHYSASCIIPYHNMSQHSVFHITTQHTAIFHITPPQLFYHTA